MTQVLSQISWTLQSLHYLTDNDCTKIPDWTLKYGINCHFGFHEGIFFINFPFFQTFSPLYDQLYLSKDTVSFFLKFFLSIWNFLKSGILSRDTVSFFLKFLFEISWFQEISWKVAPLTGCPKLGMKGLSDTREPYAHSHTQYISNRVQPLHIGRKFCPNLKSTFKKRITDKWKQLHHLFIPVKLYSSLLYIFVYKICETCKEFLTIKSVNCFIMSSILLCLHLQFLWKNAAVPQYRHDGLVVRASASRSGGRGFEPRPGHTKDFKNGTYCLHVRCSAFKNGKGKLTCVATSGLTPTVVFTAFSRRVA